MTKFIIRSLLRIFRDYLGPAVKTVNMNNSLRNLQSVIINNFSKDKLHMFVRVICNCSGIKGSVILTHMKHETRNCNKDLARTFEDLYLASPLIQSVTGDWRKRHNEQLHNLYSSPNIHS
jgi:hypothetical protein